MMIDRGPINYSSHPDAKWDSDAFEDQIARTIIALYERPASVAPGSWWPGASAADLAAIRARGAYIQHPNRIVFNDELDVGLDEIYSGMFVKSEFMLHQSMEVASQIYAWITVIKRAPAIPKPFYSVAPGTPYCLINMLATHDGALETWKHYFTVKSRRISLCAFTSDARRRIAYAQKQPMLGNLSADEYAAKQATVIANTLVDRSCQWGILSCGDEVNVELQCYHDEVKSLLYARSLPMTATGRKRPILHLVAAHRRRIKEGIDIDIEQFLRGVRKVEMGGAIFEVRAPEPPRDTWRPVYEP